eukprot:CAMPEP_0177756756 /NCGR_PEP_ID=MMETSP0491_2-20121128/3277_1 /TAXON_ID=63592 /ORGANISM="Tetraselmis chuii, Strain PLY429" /LENGTH=158 /DNA_ID=CAMNT_0019272357 /DNA_START=215 /DNA_END=691 /DNA_ORIENTATION=-
MGSRIHLGNSSAVCNDYWLVRPPLAVHRKVLNLVDNFVALKHPAKNDMPAVQPGGLRGGDKKLDPLVFGPALAMLKDALGMRDLEILILEVTSVNRPAPRSISALKVSALDHKVFDDAVEGAASVAKPLLTRSELSKVFRGFGHNVPEQSEHDTAQRL